MQAGVSAAAPDAVSSGCAVSVPRGLLLQLLLAHVGDLGGKDAGHREVLRVPGRKCGAGVEWCGRLWEKYSIYTRPFISRAYI